MKTKNIIISILILVIIGVAVFLFLNKPINIVVQNKQMAYDTKPLVVKIDYPYIAGLNDFNDMVQGIISKEIGEFKDNSLENDAAVKKIDPIDYAKYPRQYELDIGYDKGETDNNVVSIVFNVYNFEGGAHGASYFVPLNYNPKTKTEIKLSDLFPGQPNYLQKISDFCTADLTKQLTKALGSLNGTYLADGAGPKEENFQFFLINKNNIVFYFPQYQVAYGAAGDFKVTMPR
jgi:hypothetical protein